MKKIVHHIKNKLEEVRSGDEDVKKIWHFGLSAVTMGIVVFIWMGYMSASIPAIAPPAGAVARVPAPRELGIVETFGRGLGTIVQGTGDRLGRGLALIKNIFSAKEVVVEKVSPATFVPQNILEEVPKTELP